MCGIFGYIGNKNASPIITEGLKRLEYRGYDSWGIAVADGKIDVYKTVGAIGDHKADIDLPNAFVGIGHTRWATHGGITENNAHPHKSSDNTFVIAQNGIVENYIALKELLEGKGAKFTTETDTEVIVRLIEEEFKKSKDLIKSVRSAFLQLEGRNTILVLTQDKEIIAARNGSPLVIGLSPETGETFFSSDTLSFSKNAKKIIVVDNGQLVYSRENKINLMDIKSGKDISYKPENISVLSDDINKEGYAHFMLKEIHESPLVIKQLISQDLSDYKKLSEAIKKAGTVYTVGSGSAGIAASQIAFYLRENAGINAISLVGADSMEYFNLFKKDDLIIAPSQSGETADVLEVLEVAKKKGVQIASLVNMPGSTMTRISDFKFMAQAGPEICVMSTKVFVSQLTWGYLLSKIVAGSGDNAVKNLHTLSEQLSVYLNDPKTAKGIQKVAKSLIKPKDIFLLGKYQNFNIAREGMVKLIEGSYKHAHAIPAGDLKHYAITLMEPGVPVITIVSEDVAKTDILSAISQVKARGATVIGISSQNHDNFDHILKVPYTEDTAAITNIIPLQLLAYYLTVDLGHNVDRPRNIAKSVTVK
jgi:glucosamine--fructose-6-phosphate aminotransferase (isomerizing)